MSGRDGLTVSGLNSLLCVIIRKGMARERGTEGIGWYWLLDLLWLDERWSSGRCGKLVVLERLDRAPATRECFVWTIWLLVMGVLGVVVAGCAFLGAVTMAEREPAVPEAFRGWFREHLVSLISMRGIFWNACWHEVSVRLHLAVHGQH